MERFGERLKAAREMMLLSQEEFANMVSLAQSNLSAIESGKRNAGIKVISSIRERTPISIEWLSTGRGDMFRHHVSLQDRVKGIMHKERLEPLGLANMIGLQFSGEIVDVLMNYKEPSDGLITAIIDKFPQHKNFLTSTLLVSNEVVAEDITMIPIIPDTVVCGIGKYLDTVEITKIKKIAATIHNYDGVILAISVKDESMMPRYVLGDKLLIVPTSVEEIIYNVPYVVDTKYRILITNIMQANTENSVLCRFNNPDNPPYNLKTKNILSLFAIIGLIRY